MTEEKYRSKYYVCALELKIKKEYKEKKLKEYYAKKLKELQSF